MSDKKKNYLLVLFAASIILSSCGSYNFAVDKGSNSDAAYDRASYADGEGIADEYMEEAADAGSFEEAGSVSSDVSTPSSEDISKDTLSPSKKLDREKIVYSGNVSIETLDWDKSRKALDKLIEKYDGIVQYENEYTNSYDYYGSSNTGTRNLSTTVRIPSENFKKFMKSTGDVGSVTSKSSNADNITGDYYDTKARLDTYEAEQQRLLTLLDTATKMSDILKIESKLSDLQYQIDSTRSRLENMDMDVAYSTVEISLAEVFEYTAEEKSFSEVVKETLLDSLHFFLNFLHILAVGILYLGPCAIVILLILFGIIKLFRKFHKSNPDNPDKKGIKLPFSKKK